MANFGYNSNFKNKEVNKYGEFENGLCQRFRALSN